MALKDDDDEEVQKYEGNYEHETKEINVSLGLFLATSLHRYNSLLIRLFVLAVKGDGFLSAAVVHDKVPRFTG